MKLFVFKGDGLYAITEDREGEKLPQAHGPWEYVKDIELERGSGSRVGVDPEIVLDNISGQGYYLSNFEIKIEENEPGR